jgi:hypothetical protein
MTAAGPAAMSTALLKPFHSRFTPQELWSAASSAGMFVLGLVTRPQNCIGAGPSSQAHPASDMTRGQRYAWDLT